LQLAIDIPALGSTPLLGSSEKLLLLRLGGRHFRLLEDLGLSKQLRTPHLSRRALIAQPLVISTALVAQLLQSLLEGHHRRLLGLERLEQCISTAVSTAVLSASAALAAASSAAPCKWACRSAAWAAVTWAAVTWASRSAAGRPLPRVPLSRRAPSCAARV
jgi:hypothetical protein